MASLIRLLVAIIFILFTLLKINAIDNWEDYKHKYGKSYNHSEDIFRKSLYLRTCEKINQLNNYQTKELSFKVGLNKFADMTDDEYSKISSSGIGMLYEEWNALPFENIAKNEVPDSVDWVEYGFNTSVIDQKKCGSCYAMASICSIEGHYYVETKIKVKLSEQEIIDCSKSYGNKGCSYGYEAGTFKYVLRNGVGTEERNPYQGIETECNQREPRYLISGWYKSAQNDEIALMAAVSRGPVMVLIYANLDSFRFYESGIYKDNQCILNPDNVNHFVTVVGYGKNNNNEEYWLIKNSWGEQWGSKGYMYMARNLNNTCGIAYQPVYPKILKNSEFNSRINLKSKV